MGLPAENAMFPDSFLATSTAVSNDRPDMIWLSGGTFRMGSDSHYPEEAPAHRVTVDGFWMDRTPVTNREFRKFVNATRYVTFAEIRPDPKDYPGALRRHAEGGIAGIHAAQAAGRPARLGRVVELQVRRQLAPALRAAQLDQRTGQIIRSSISPIAMPKPTPDGPARSCRPKRNGSSPRAEGSRAPSSPGDTSSHRMGGRWRTPGRVTSRTRTAPRTATSAHRPSQRFRPTAMASTT